jgi:hypothetical protein
MGKPDVKSDLVITFGPVDAVGCKAWLARVLKLDDFNLDFLDYHAPLRARILTHFVIKVLKTVPDTQEQLETCFLEALETFKSDVRERLAKQINDDPRKLVPVNTV